MATRSTRSVKSPTKPGKTAAAAPAPKKGGAKAAKPRARAGKGGALVIVESPTKAKTIGKYLGAGYDVRATVGHLRDLPTRELGVDVERDFEPKYVTIKGKTKTLAELKKAAKTASTVYLATDPDREGEAIAWHVADQLGVSVPTHRVLFHEITKDAIHEAMERPG
ncbi:MAG: toprim domain-containing protein, partial [Gemmatimonadales bacterium]